MVSHTDQFRRLLREAQDAVHELHDHGRSTKALELELRRGEQAIEARRWGEAKSHLDRVLSRRNNPKTNGDEDRYQPSEAAAAAAAASAAVNGTVPHLKADSVRGKLRMARERLALLTQFGADIEGLLASLVRAEDFLTNGFIASAESIADELLVLSKAAAEGVRSRVAPAAGSTDGAAPAEGGNEFLGMLRGSLADLVSAQGWIDEGKARTLIAEGTAELPRWDELSKRLADAAREPEAALEQVASELRGELAEARQRADALVEEQARAMAGLRVGLEASDEVADKRAQRAALHEQQLVRIAGECRANVEALARLESAVEEWHRLLSTRVDASALADLASAVATLKQDVQDRAATVEVSALRDGLDQDLTALRLQQQEALSQLDTRASDRIRAAVAAIDQRLTARIETLDEHGQVLINLEETLDDLRQACQGKVDTAVVAAISERTASIAGETDDLRTARDALVAGHAEERRNRAALEARVDALSVLIRQRDEKAVAAPATDPTLAALAATEGRWRDEMAGLSRSLETRLTKLDDKLAALSERLARSEETPAVAPADVTGRIGRLAQQVAALAQKSPETSTIRATATAIATLKATLAAHERNIAELDRRLQALGTSAPASAAAASDNEDRLAALAEAVTARAGELESRIAALESAPAPAAGASAGVDEKALCQHVVEILKPLLPKGQWISEQIQGAVQTAMDQQPAGGLDAKQLRKMLPDLLSTPEARGTIATTVILEALDGHSQLGDISGIRAALRDEIRRIVAESDR